jgi:hypothetical protein
MSVINKVAQVAFQETLVEVYVKQLHNLWAPHVTS